MPSVNLSPETYEKLAKLAARKGCSPDEMAEVAVDRHVSSESMTDEQWRREFRQLREEIQASLPAELTEQQIQDDIDQTLREVRAGRRARSR